MKTRNYNFHQKKPFFSNNSFCYRNSFHNKMNKNDCKEILKNISINHNFDLICFQKCSNWILKLSKSSSKNKNTFSNEFSGGINENHIFIDKKFHIQNELSSYFPIDIRNNQRFSLDKNQPKIPLLITFNFDDLKKEENEVFTKINSDFSNLLFEIDLNANLHEFKNIFKDNINFKVKGFDIMKSIQNKINGLKINKIIDINGEYLFFENYVFNNIQCSFGIGFSISKNSLINYLKLKNYSIFENEVQITKIFLNYSLPLIVFTKSNILHQQIFNNNNVNNKNNSINLIHPNFCNFHSFMTNTTPFIYESEEIKIKTILDSFTKSSIFGINCLFKLDNLKFANIKYYPILNSLYINTINNSNNNSTLDGSFFSKSSEDKENKNTHSQNNICFKESIKEIYNMPNFIEQYKKIKKNFPEIDELELGEINNDSYFSLIWSPLKNIKDKNFNKVEFDCLNNISFEIFYKFKSGINNGHYLTVFGINEKNIKGFDINGENIFPYFEFFWFSNKNIVPLPFMKNYNFLLFQQQQNMIMNKNLFYALKNNSNNNKSFLGISEL